MTRNNPIQHNTIPENSHQSRNARRSLYIVSGIIGALCLICVVAAWSVLPHRKSPHQLLTFSRVRGHDAGQMYTVSYMGVDGQGRIYIGDWDDGRVSVFDASGKDLRVVNLPDGTELLGMAVAQDGTLYFSYDGSIHRMNPDGSQSTISYVNSKGSTLANISGIGLGPDGTLAAGDNFGDVLTIPSSKAPQVVLAKAFDLPSFSSRNELEPGGGAPVGSYDVPANSADKNVSVAVDASGNIYMLGWISAEVIKTDPQGGSLSKFGSFSDFPGGWQRGRFDFPTAIVVDSAGRIYVSDSSGVQVFSADEKYLYSIHLPDGVQAMTLDSQDNLYVVTEPYDHQLGGLVYKVIKFAALK